MSLATESRLETPDAAVPSRLSWRQSEWLKVAAVVAIFVWYPLATLKAPLVDPDIWWHMATGEWIVRHHAFPRTDPFSIGGAAKQWVAYSWAYEVLVYAIGKYWDLVGLSMFRVLVWLAATGALFALMKKVAGEFWRAALLTVVASYTMARVFGPRPGAFTVLFFAIELLVLCDAERSRRTVKLWLLPVLFCVWANVHVQFVYGLFVLGLFAIESVIGFVKQPWVEHGRMISDRTLWLVLAVSAVATLVNPYGWGVYKVVFTYGHQIWSTRYIGEMGPLPFDQFSDYMALILALGAGFALGTSRRVRPVYVLLLLWAAVSAFRTQRDIWVLAIVACCIIGERVRAADSDVAMERRTGLLAVAATLVALLVGWQFAPGNRELLSDAALRLPLGSVAYVHEHHLQGPIFNNFDWGGFLIYALPGEPVAIDGRTNIHGDNELQRSFDTWNALPDWQSDPLLQQANLVVASPQYALTQVLKMDPQFKVVFDDKVSVLFERVDARGVPY